MVGANERLHLLLAGGKVAGAYASVAEGVLRGVEDAVLR